MYSRTAHGGDRILFFIAIASFFVYLLVIYFEPLNQGDTPVAVINSMERYASLNVPNYKKIWYVRSLLWMDPSIRGRKVNLFALALFGEEGLVNLGVPLKAAHLEANWSKDPLLRAPMRPWNEVCSIDSDIDGYTNGQELGDPCCIWKPGMATNWSFHLSHPGRYKTTNMSKTQPNVEAQEFINQTDCEAVRRIGYYEPSDTDFFSWYYSEHFEDVEFGSKTLIRILILTVHSLMVAFWVAEKQLWREFLPIFSKRFPSHLTIARLVAVVVCSYLFVDLASAFVHAFLDNCYISSPIVGNLCKAFMHHHYHPRSLSVAPGLYWVTHTLEGALPITAIYVVLGLLYQLPKEVELVVCLTSVFWPLTYVWHNMAHLPESQRMAWFKLLQSAGLALSSKSHFVHHRVIDTSWSSMAGIMDFVPNILVRFVYDRQNAIATFTILFIMMLGPWLMFFTYYVILGRGCSIRPRLPALFWHAVSGKVHAA